MPHPNQLPISVSYLSFPLPFSLYSVSALYSRTGISDIFGTKQDPVLTTQCLQTRSPTRLISHPTTKITSHLRHRDYEEASAPVDGVLCTKCPSMTGFMAGTIKYACAIGWERLWLSFSLGPGYRISPLLSSQGPATERERDELALPFFSFIYPPFI